MGLVAPKGKILASLDFSNQEAQIASVISADKSMSEVFLVKSTLTRPDGTKYVNPYSDMHTLSAVYCINPERYKDVPEDQWRELADNSGDRKLAKGLNFSIIFMATALAISQNNYVKEEVAKGWVENHKKTYANFHGWAQNFGNIAAARGYAITPYYGAWRYVDESNAKGSGESPARSAVNHAVQGLASSITKDAAIRIRKTFKDTNIFIVGVIHDEILIELPGSLEINTEKSKKNKDGCWTKLVWQTQPETMNILEQASQIMCQVETEVYKTFGSKVKGRAGIDIAPYWSH
jgi:DNA polymerase I-like protein with 3'-5' exonuclease and polymerase domains